MFQRSSTSSRAARKPKDSMGEGDVLGAAGTFQPRRKALAPPARRALRVASETDAHRQQDRVPEVAHDSIFTRRRRSPGRPVIRGARSFFQRRFEEQRRRHPQDRLVLWNDIRMIQKIGNMKNVTHQRQRDAAQEAFDRTEAFAWTTSSPQDLAARFFSRSRSQFLMKMFDRKKRDRPQDHQQRRRSADIGRLEEVQVRLDLEHRQGVARAALGHGVDDVEFFFFCWMLSIIRNRTAVSM